MPIYIYRDFQHCCQYIYIFSKSVRDDGDDDDHLVIHRRWWCRYFSAFLCVSQSQRFSICLCVFLRFFVILYILLDFSWFSSSSSSLLLKLCKLIFAAIANEDGLGWVRIVNRWHPQIAWPGSKLIGCLLPRWEGLVHTSLLPETVGRSGAKNAWKYSTPHTHPSSCLPPLVIPWPRLASLYLFAYFCCQHHFEQCTFLRGALLWNHDTGEQKIYPSFI